MEFSDSIRTVWKRMCSTHGDKTTHPGGFYGADGQTSTVDEDLELCQKDALAGNERAQQYMAKFVELRMKA